MQLKEILSIESDRAEDSKCVIHLFQEGSFYRAYEWSAWLCHRYSMPCFFYYYGSFDADVLKYENIWG